MECCQELILSDQCDKVYVDKSSGTLVLALYSILQQYGSGTDISVYHFLANEADKIFSKNIMVDTKGKDYNLFLASMVAGLEEHDENVALFFVDDDHRTMYWKQVAGLILPLTYDYVFSKAYFSRFHPQNGEIALGGRATATLDQPLFELFKSKGFLDKSLNIGYPFSGEQGVFNRMRHDPVYGVQNISFNDDPHVCADEFVEVYTGHGFDNPRLEGGQRRKY